MTDPTLAPVWDYLASAVRGYRLAGKVTLASASTWKLTSATAAASSATGD